MCDSDRNVSSQSRPRSRISMKKKSQKKVASLSPLEEAVMQAIWRRGSASAEDVRKALMGKHELKDSTVRTILRRLEGKGVLSHSVAGRTYIYAPQTDANNLAGDAVQQIADRFCKGSLSSLLLGMANDSRISPEELRELADKIEQAEENSSQKSSGKKKRSKKSP